MELHPGRHDKIIVGYGIISQGSNGRCYLDSSAISEGIIGGRKGVRMLMAGQLARNFQYTFSPSNEFFSTALIVFRAKEPHLSAR